MLWSYKGRIDRTVEVSQEVRDLWLDSAKTSRLDFRSRVLIAIPDEASYLQFLADPSFLRFAEFVNDEFPDAGRIETKHRVRVRRAYEAWDSNFRAASEEGGAWEQGLERGKEKYPQARYGLMCTGTLRDKPAPCWKAVYALSGSKEPLRFLMADDYWENPTAICSPFELWARRASRALLLPPLVLGAVLAIYCQELADKGYGYFGWLRDQIIEKTNSILEDYISKIKTRDCYLRLSYSEWNFWVEAGVI